MLGLWRSLTRLTFQHRISVLLVFQSLGIEFMVLKVLPTEIAAMRFVASTFRAVTDLNAIIAHHSALALALLRIFHHLLAEVPLVAYVVA